MRRSLEGNGARKVSCSLYPHSPIALETVDAHAVGWQGQLFLDCDWSCCLGLHVVLRKAGQKARTT